ncbi:GTA-gp10 family protein [Novosphingobium piscinae]|uniref:Gene transfer agent family protein n=1 Tax=Novosphingobium piscinae TaxID=1507448 RepID=A0A7X1KRL0_9SPHN|nr:GTA-gp10 family protein [Novosphingobium piscinae]MBC2670916.1 gene transfer agent family protein [Novosphingobium piscinae]
MTAPTCPLRGDPNPLRGDANPLRGEAVLPIAGVPRLLRPSFAALVAAEAELGPLFALVERAAAGQLGLGETVALLWHCLVDRATIPREAVGEAVAAMGLAAAAAPLRALLAAILQGEDAAAGAA